MVSPKDLGRVGMLKALIQAGLALGAVGIALTWPQEFNDPAALGGLFLTLAGAFAVVEWLARSWYEERLQKMQEVEDAGRRGKVAVEAAIAGRITAGLAAEKARAEGLDACLAIANERLTRSGGAAVFLNASSNRPDLHTLTNEERERLK